MIGASVYPTVTAQIATTTAMMIEITLAIRRPLSRAKISNTAATTLPPSSGSTGSRLSSDQPTLM
jgi:hypothetical protein